MRLNSPKRQDDLTEEMDDLDMVVLDSDEDLEEITEDQLMDLAQSAQSDDSDEEEQDDTPVVDMATTTFSQHTKSVFGCDINYENGLAVSGGEDDKAFVWNINTGEVLFPCFNHTDSVTCVKFSHDGQLVATGDMNGFIQVWKIQTKTKIWEFDVADLSWLLWHPKSNVLFAGTYEGDMWMWLVKTGTSKTFPSFGSGSSCGALSPDGTKLVSGYENGEVRIFDCKTAQQIHCFSGFGMHLECITQVSWHQNRPLIICSSISGEVKILNSNNGSIVATYECHKIKTAEDEPVEESTMVAVETASFCPTNSQYSATGNLLGVVSIWDLTSQSARNHIIQGCSTSKIVWHPTETVFFAAGLDGVVWSYDVISGDLKQKYTGHRQKILDIAISSNGEKLVTSSDDNTCKIFEIGSTGST